MTRDEIAVALVVGSLRLDDDGRYLGITPSEASTVADALLAELARTASKQEADADTVSRADHDVIVDELNARLREATERTEASSAEMIACHDEWSSVCAALGLASEEATCSEVVEAIEELRASRERWRMAAKEMECERYEARRLAGL